LYLDSGAHQSAYQSVVSLKQIFVDYKGANERRFVNVNNVWDKISKVLILIVDAGLNWYFLRTVKIRLVRQHGLVKYQPLVGFNAKLMVVSIAMDVSLQLLIRHTSIDAS
jgi:hypothetical protein